MFIPKRSIFIGLCIYTMLAGILFMAQVLVFYFTDDSTFLSNTDNQYGAFSSPDVSLDFLIASIPSLFIWGLGVKIFKLELPQNPAPIKTMLQYIISVLIVVVIFLIIDYTRTYEIEEPLRVVYNTLYYASFGIWEEILFRGLILGFILQYFVYQRGMNATYGVIISAILFGWIHIFNIDETQSEIETILQVGIAFFGGIGYGYLYAITGRIIYPIICHSLYNMSMSLDAVIQYNPYSTTQSLLEILSNPLDATFYILIYLIDIIFAYAMYEHWRSLQKG